MHLDPGQRGRAWTRLFGATGIRAADVVVVVIGHLPGRAETPGGWAAVAPATMIHLTVRPGRMTTQRHMELPNRRRTRIQRARRIADSVLAFLWSEISPDRMQNIRFGCC
jgi:hypothetical protein